MPPIVKISPEHTQTSRERTRWRLHELRIGDGYELTIAEGRRCQAAMAIFKRGQLGWNYRSKRDSVSRIWRLWRTA